MGTLNEARGRRAIAPAAGDNNKEWRFGEMSEAAKNTMNGLTIEELDALHVGCGFVAIIGNSTLCAVVPEEKAQQAETERVNRGF